MTGVTNTSGKFMTVVNSSGNKFMTVVVDTDDKSSDTNISANVIMNIQNGCNPTIGAMEEAELGKKSRKSRVHVPVPVPLKLNYVSAKPSNCSAAQYPVPIT